MLVIIEEVRILLIMFVFVIFMEVKVVRIIIYIDIMLKRLVIGKYSI